MSSSATSSESLSEFPTPSENRVVGLARIRGAPSELTVFFAQWLTAEQVASLHDHLRKWFA